MGIKAGIRIFIAVAALLYCGSAGAEPFLDQVKEDFKPLSGVLVMPAGNEYIIDLDAGNGVKVGDLFAVVQQGTPIIHPMTGKVLGTMDDVKAVLRVSRILSGHSYVVLVSGSSDLAKGTKITRNENLRATFRDETGRSEVMASQLQQTLPNLRWQNADSTLGSELIFVATQSGLLVRSSSGQILHSYNVASQTPAPQPVLQAQPVRPSAPVVYGQQPAMPPLQQGNITYEAAPMYQGGYRMEMDFPRFDKIGSFAKTTIMSDFEKYKDTLLMASTDGSTIRVFQVGEGLQILGQGDTSSSGQILSVSWWQPQPDEELYLAVTLWTDDKIQSEILRWDGTTLTSAEKGVSRLLAAFDFDRNGSSEMLLGQDFDRAEFYGNSVVELKLQGGKLEKSKTPLEFPRNFRVLGALLVDINGNGSVESVFVLKRRLFVYSGKKQLYKSGKEMGGTLAGITYDVDPDAQNPMVKSAACNVAPVVADLDGDGRVEIVAIASEGSAMQTVGLIRTVDKSWLSVFKFERGMMVKGTLGDKLERPLQGLAVEGNNVLMVATDNGGLMGTNPASYVLSIPVI